MISYFSSWVNCPLLVLPHSFADKPWGRWRLLCGSGFTVGSRSRSSHVLPSSTTQAFLLSPRPSTSTPTSWPAELRLSTSSCLTTWTTWMRISCLEICNVRVHMNLLAVMGEVANEPRNSPRLCWENPKICRHDYLDFFFFFLCYNCMNLCLLPPWWWRSWGSRMSPVEWVLFYICLIVNVLFYCTQFHFMLFCWWFSFWIKVLLWPSVYKGTWTESCDLWKLKCQKYTWMRTSSCADLIGMVVSYGAADLFHWILVRPLQPKRSNAVGAHYNSYLALKIHNKKNQSLCKKNNLFFSLQRSWRNTSGTSLAQRNQFWWL